MGGGRNPKKPEKTQKNLKNLKNPQNLKNFAFFLDFQGGGSFYAPALNFWEIFEKPDLILFFHDFHTNPHLCKSLPTHLSTKINKYTRF